MKHTNAAQPSKAKQGRARLKRFVRLLVPRLKTEWHGEWGVIWLNRQWCNWLHPTKFFDCKFPPLCWWLHCRVSKHGGDQTMLSVGLLGLCWHKSFFKKADDKLRHGGGNQ